MIEFVDGNAHRNGDMRIVSLLPSATEILCLLGLENQLVAVSHECDFPSSVRALPKATQSVIPWDAASSQIDELVRQELRTRNALYTLDLSVLEEAQPDLIVTQALCDVCAVAEEDVTSAARSLPGTPRLVNLEPTRLGEVLCAIRQVGEAAGVVEQASIEVARLQARIDGVAQRTSTIAERTRVLLLEWIDPPFCAGHWSPELVRLAGGREMLGREGIPSRKVAWEEVVAADPEVLVIACCGYDTERTLRDLSLLLRYDGWQSLHCVRSDRAFVMDGSAYFNRPGPRLVDSLEILSHALHPTVHPLPSKLAAAYHLSRRECGLAEVPN